MTFNGIVVVLEVALLLQVVLSDWERGLELDPGVIFVWNVMVRSILRPFCSLLLLPAILIAVVVANLQRRQVALLVVVVVVVSVIVVEVGRRRILVQWILAVRRRDGLPGSRAHVLVAVGFVKQFERVRGVVREEEVEEVFECRW